VGGLKWTELAFTRFASLVAGRSLLGLPGEDPLLGGTVDSYFRLFNTFRFLYDLELSEDIRHGSFDDFVSIAFRSRYN
jgi:hypothetical protein